MKPVTKSIIGYISVSCVILIILLTLYFYIAPILAEGLGVFRCRHLNLETAKDYYSILSSWMTFFVGVSGLILGFVYYKHKLCVDSNISSIERKRKRLDDLILKINAYDRVVDTIIYNRFGDDKELKYLRSRISRNFEEIVIMLELSHKLLGLDEAETRTILRVNSFVEKNNILMHFDFQSLNEDALLTVKDDYVDLIQDARRICLKKVS